MKLGDIKCKVCGKKAYDGYAIYRTSPKGQDFEGVCNEHRIFPLPDGAQDIAGMIEEENHPRAKEQK